MDMNASRTESVKGIGVTEGWWKEKDVSIQILEKRGIAFE